MTRHCTVTLMQAFSPNRVWLWSTGATQTLFSPALEGRKLEAALEVNAIALPARVHHLGNEGLQALGGETDHLAKNQRRGPFPGAPAGSSFRRLSVGSSVALRIANRLYR